MIDAELKTTLEDAIAGFKGNVLTPELRAQIYKVLEAKLLELIPDRRPPTVVSVPEPGDAERGIMRFDIRGPEDWG